jgi:hypothetical protein
VPTQSSGKVSVENIHRRKTKHFEERLEEHLCLPDVDQEHAKLDDMMLSCPPDDGEARQTCFAPQKPFLNPSGISNYDRATCKIQSLNCNELFSTDHTLFELMKNLMARKAQKLELL